jgi:hypothetical protein
MPPKDPIVAPLAPHDRLDFPTTTTTRTASATAIVSSSSSPTAPFVFQHGPTTSNEHLARQQPCSPKAMPLLLPETNTHSSSSTSLVGQPPTTQQLPTHFGLLPRPEETSTEQDADESSKIPVFLAFLNKLHGPNSQQHQQTVQVQQTTSLRLSTTASVLSATKAIPNFQPRVVPFKDQQQRPHHRKVVQFAPPPHLQKVHPILSRHDMTTREIQNTWYSQRYVGLKNNNDNNYHLDKFHHHTTASSSSSSSLLTTQNKRDLIFAGKYIRRARRAALIEQAGQVCQFPPT